MVNQIFTNYKRQWDAACQLEEEATALPTIVSTLKDMIELVGKFSNDTVEPKDALEPKREWEGGKIFSKRKGRLERVVFH